MLNRLFRPWFPIAMFLAVLYVIFFLIPLARMNRATTVTQWRVVYEGYGLGFPWLGKSVPLRAFDCSGSCGVHAIQRVSFGPLYYERRLETVMPSGGINEAQEESPEERRIGAAFDELGRY